MRIVDIIAKKIEKKELADAEIKFFVDGYTNGEIPDYQASALLMAIFFNGLSEEETTNLTMHMARSGEMIDLSSISGIKVDKHSTGGVGDKTTLIVAPIVASLGIKVAKMSGRGLGHTGGTIDKMESIPGMKISIEKEEFFEIVNKVGVSVVGQSGNLVPADKKIYALRDVTATVNSMPLIASSIMSKKIAAGSDCILLDVKMGSGAFMKNIDDAIDLSKLMVKIGENVGRKTVALITNMDKPLGNAIGNSLEIVEVCQTLKGNGPDDLTKICIELAANMLQLAGLGGIEKCRKMAKNSIENGSAFLKLKEMVAAQGGDVSYLDDNNKFSKAAVVHEILAEKTGYISSMETEKCGIAAMILGAGRETKDSCIDYSAGIILHKKVGDFINKGDCIATFYSSTYKKCQQAQKIFMDSLVISSDSLEYDKLIYAKVDRTGVNKC